MQSVPFITKVSLISTHGKVCTILGQCLHFSGYSGFLQLGPKINVTDINKPNLTFIMECLDLWEWILNIRFNSFSFSSWVREDQLTCVIVKCAHLECLFKVYISCIHCFNAKHEWVRTKSGCPRVWMVCQSGVTSLSFECCLSLVVQECG